jgi:hypothetical protein
MNVFKDIEFLASLLTEIPKPANIETVCFEVEITGICTLSTSNGQKTAEVLKKISRLADDSEHRVTSEKRGSTTREILTVSPIKNNLERKRGRKTKKQIDFKQTNSQPINKMVVRETATESEEKTHSIICGESFVEHWIHFLGCGGWGHENCAELEGFADSV